MQASTAKDVSSDKRDVTREAAQPEEEGSYQVVTPQHVLSRTVELVIRANSILLKLVHTHWACLCHRVSWFEEQY